MKELKLFPRKGMVDNDLVEEVALVDDEDYEELSNYTWYYKRDNAGDPERVHVSIGRNAVSDAGTHKRTSLVLLNRQIMKIDDPKIQVRFKDGNPLNCQKENLYIKVDGHALTRLREAWFERLSVEYNFPR